MNIEQYIIEIKNQLKSQGYVGKKIDYSEFASLYQTYCNHFTKREFAYHVLEMSYDQYDSIKKGKDRAKILKKQLTEIIQQDVEEIKNTLGKEGYSGKLIDYTELQKLHQMYGSQMPENQFAKYVLDLNYTSYMQVKSGKRKVIILKSLQKNALEDIEKIKEMLKNQGYAGKLIDYAELQNLHQTYGKLFTETQFAQKVLELSSSTYLDLKNYGKKARVLKKIINQEFQENIEKIKEQLETQGYAGKAIDYAEFQKLHQMYGGQMPEYKFAREVLEISSSSYKTSLKKRHGRAIILKSLVIQVSPKEIERIKEILKSQGYAGKLIDYSELQKLHQLYGSQMPEYKFSQEVLEISTGLYGNIKYNERKKAAILKSLINQASQEDIENIQETLEAKGIAGMLIDYAKLQRLHQEYGSQMAEDIFAQQVPEIPTYSYRGMKDREYETQILCHNKKVELIHSILLKDSRWYTKEELEQICMQNAISMDKIIRQVISNGTNIYNEYYKRVLEEKGKLWIGRTSISEQFLEENMDTIMKLAKTALYSVKWRYGISQNSEDEDLIQDSIIWIVQNAGEIEKNFIDYPSIMERKIFNTIRKGITIKVLVSYETRIKTVSFNKKLKLGKGVEKELESRIASPYDLESDVIENMDDNNMEDIIEDIESEEELAAKCIQEMKSQIEVGLSKQIILSNIEEMFGLSKEELLELMQSYLVEKGTVKIEKGKARWATNLEEEK